MLGGLHSKAIARHCTVV